jgi:hypothetical protein
LRFLADDREGELVVPLGDQRNRVAVSGLEGEGASGMRAAAAGCVDGEEDAGSVDYACWGGGGYCPSGSCVLVAVLVLDVVAG